VVTAKTENKWVVRILGYLCLGTFAQFTVQGLWNTKMMSKLDSGWGLLFFWVALVGVLPWIIYWHRRRS
jgi:hypothetical protein